MKPISCGAMTREEHRCTQPSSTIRGGVFVCGTHANTYDEYAGIVGEGLALTRIIQGRDACGDINAAARAHSMRVLGALCDDAGFTFQAVGA